MEERLKAALARFEEGYDCSHAILSAYADLFEFDEKSMEAIRKPCCAMMGKPTSVCGAVMGAMKILDQRMRNEEAAGASTRKKSEMVREFRARFEKIHGSVTCVGLLGVDLSDRDGQNAAVDQDLFHSRCVRYITDAALILEDLTGIKAGAV